MTTQSCYAYASVAMPNLAPSALTNIIVQSRAFNRQHGITGILLYDGTSFYQYIEGALSGIQEAKRRILASRHHHSVEELASGIPASPGRFSAWTLGYLFIDEEATSVRTVLCSLEQVELVAAFQRFATESDSM